MPGQMPLRPDPMPLREALRGLRHALRRGGETLRDTMPIDALPGPAAAFAGTVLREIDSLARGVEGVASGLAKTVLGAPDAASASLRGLTAGDDARFAQAVYAALRAVLRRLGAPGTFISEAAARKAFLRVVPPGQPDGSDAQAAAALTLALLDLSVMRDTSAAEAARVPGSAVEPVAVFAVMLWLQSDRSEAEDEAALDAATDLAVALADDVARACGAQDAAALATLYARFAAHV